MIQNEFRALTQLEAWCQKVLPLVYDESLSYYELLCKVLEKVNALIENNNKLPQYILDLIKEYIQGPEFQQIMSDLLSALFINVKFPPTGIPPAVGDGSADDTLSLQGCIDYAATRNLTVFIPAGVYLTQSLVFKTKASIFGMDANTTRLVLKGGATGPLVTGNVDGIGIHNISFDANMDIQVNNIDCVSLSCANTTMENLFFVDGYDNLAIQKTGGYINLKNLVFGKAVVHNMVVGGAAGNIFADGITFGTLSTLNGESCLFSDASNDVYKNLYARTSVPTGIEIDGNNNVIEGYINSPIPIMDSGNNNTVHLQMTEYHEIFTGDINTKAQAISTTATNGIERMAANISDNASNAITQNAKNITLNASDNYSLSANASISQVTQGNFTATNLATNIKATEGASIAAGTDLSVSGNNVNVTATNKIMNSGLDVELNPTNPLTYKTPAQFNKYFDSVKFKDSNTIYDVLVANANTNMLTEDDFKNVKKYGAKGDGVTDDTAAINNVLAEGGVIYFPAGTYMIKCEDGNGKDGIQYCANYGLQVKSNTDIILDEGAILKVIPNQNPTYVLFNLQNVNNVSITGGTLYGDKETHIIPPDNTHEWGFAIFSLGCQNVKISNIRITQFTGDGIYMGLFPSFTSPTGVYVQCQNMQIDFVRITYVRRNGISVCAGADFFISNVLFENIVGTEPQCAIDIEAEGFTDTVRVDSVTISDCFENNCQNFIRKHHGTNIKVSRCTSSYAKICYNESFNSNSVIISDCYFSNGVVGLESAVAIVANSVCSKLNFGEVTNNFLDNVLITQAGIYNTNSSAVFSNCRFDVDNFVEFAGSTLNYTFNNCQINATEQGINFKGGRHMFNGCTFRVANIPYQGLGSETIFRNCEFIGCGGTNCIRNIADIRLIVQNCGFYDIANNMDAITHSEASTGLYTGNAIIIQNTQSKATYAFEVINPSSVGSAYGNYTLDSITNAVYNTTGTHLLGGYNVSMATNDGFLTSVAGADVAESNRHFLSTP